MKGAAFLADIGSTFTKGRVVSLESFEVVCSGQAGTARGGDAGAGFRNLRNIMLAKSGSVSFSLQLASSSARGGLRVSVIGLMPELTLKAARAACLNAGARLLSCYSRRIGGEDAMEIKNSRPDIVLLAGGTDGGDRESVLHNARMLSAEPGDYAVIYAGNREAAEDAGAILEGVELHFADNVLPELDILSIEPARKKIRELFMSKIVSAKGLDIVAAETDGPVVPTPSAVLEAVSLLSERDDVMAVDVGGATTDVYSAASGAPSSPGRVVLRGVPEPYLKRTVEGDIGLRISLPGLLSAAGGSVHKACSEGWTVKASADISILPENEEELMCDAVLAGHAAGIAVRRHCGTLEERFTPEGRIFVQEGKDLRGVKKIAASGGVFAGNRFAPAELARVLEAGGAGCLAPRSAEIIPDRDYLLYAAGLLASVDAEAAMLTMEKSFTKNAER